MKNPDRSHDLERLRINRDKAEMTFRRPRRMKIIVGAVLLAALILIIGVLYATDNLSLARKVEVAKVTRIYPAQAITVLNASGYVVAQRQAAVSSKSTGRLAYLGVEEGSRVKKGQIIATLENDDLVAARNHAAANIKIAEAELVKSEAERVDATLNYQRMQELVATDLVAKQDFDAAYARYKKAVAGVALARANINAARAALAQAQTSVAYTHIRGPFDGLVLTKNAEVGEVVAPFGSATNARAAVVTMADMDSLMVEADVAESNIGQVSLRQPCEIRLDALPEQRFRGIVHMIVPTADRSKATILTKIAFLQLDPRILPEMSAKVAFLSRPLTDAEQKPRLVVSPQALVRRQGQLVALVIQGNRIRTAPVKIGSRLGQLVEIQTGLKEGDRVVLSPPADLQDGDKVKLGGA